MTAQTKDDVPFDISAYRIIFYEQSIKGSKKLAADLDVSVKDLLKSLDRTNNPVQEALAHRSSIITKKRALVFDGIGANRLRQRVRQAISGEAILYADQLADLDLEKIRTKYGLGHKTLSQFVRLILKHDCYTDMNKLNEFIMKYSLETEPDSAVHL